MNQAVLVNPGALPFVKRVRAHLAIMRLDHLVKQIFVLPGIVVALTLGTIRISPILLWHALLGLLTVTLIASSNYVLNEMLDAPFDRLHPSKHSRPAACGAIYYPAGYAQWLLLGALGLLLAHSLSAGLTLSMIAFWFMGCVYNIAPIRTKDIPWLDVLSESINNPLRFCAGWYIVAIAVPPISLLISYWMLGAYFMALKRFSEYRQIGTETAGWYRKSFRIYTEKSLLNSVMFYAAAAMLFFGAFIMRYRLELVFSFPIIALLMALYFNMAFEPDSAVQNPEKLYREPKLLVLLSVCIVLLVVLLFVKMPWLAQVFPKSVLQ
ncbi:UbiA family prenyltransferase [Paracidobacterium acidisoli]|uniref:Prenyltransferase n=1 Tax=Paracidobacterium acidisoli TaxID=2303751 RepID=A0A372IV21_9BACT|nr:UbiA family prenyltransferase [Paracidobacterium acidisoli]MBT9329691.1 UbiA family prenyltransferase [Paracidobacterium acidisoli]